MKKLILLLLFINFVSLIFGQEKFSDEIIQQLLDRHNYYRQEQGAPDLIWSDELAEIAQSWANANAKKDKMIHSNYPYGENIYSASYIPSPYEVVDLWASEQQFYNGEAISHQNYSLFGHYTQVIWSSTVSVGCATAVSKSGRYYWVCEYDPAGNYINEKPVQNYKKPEK